MNRRTFLSSLIALTAFPSNGLSAQRMESITKHVLWRNRDGQGYLTSSVDGLRWEPKRAWAWDDGESIEMSSTQQHWLSHSDGLFLVYTRKDTLNANVIRWRAPLRVAQIELGTLRLIRSSEKVVLPLVGDGVNDPDGVALMGNFHVTNAGPYESWVTVGEWMPRRKALGDLLLARLQWSSPNRSMN